MLLALAKTAAVYGTAVATTVGRRVAMSIVWSLAIGGLFAISLCFLTLSGYRAIAQSLGDIYAPLIIGCLYFVAGLVAMLVMQLRRR